MQEVYAALLLHDSKQQISFDSVKKVLESAGAQVDDVKVKALVASLENVNIDEALKEAVSFAAAAPATGGSEKEEKKDEQEEAKAAEQASAGLSSLFG